jgi:hypothetical protein
VRGSPAIRAARLLHPPRYRLLMDTHSAYSGASQTATVTSALRSAPDPERCTDLPAWVTVYTL